MAKKKNESNRARKVRRAVVGKFKIDNKPKKSGGKKSGSNKKSGAKKSTTTTATTPKKSNTGVKKVTTPKKGTKREGRFEGMTTSEIRDFKEKKGRGKFAKEEVAPIVEPVELAPTETQLPETTSSFDYEGALSDMKAEYEERQRLAEEKYARAIAEYEQGERTQMENQARSGQQAEYKLGSPSERMRGGTFGFRRRKRRLMGGIGAVNSLAAGAGGGMLNF